jgi:two-component system sensor histidine kinase UhpB
MRTAGWQRGPERAAPWRDIALVVIVTTLGGIFAAYFNWSESLFAWTRRFEHWQLDELPAVFTVLFVGLAWFAWRRYRDARSELLQRRTAEARLEQLLLDNRRLARQFLHMQESERKFLARELHDELGQYLNAIKIDAVSIQQRVVEPTSPIVRGATDIIRHIDHVSDVVRDLIGKLRPTGLDELGLKAAFEHCVEEWRPRLPHVHFSVALEGDLDSLDEVVALTLYRLVQEGVTNVSRHSRARHVDISVRRAPDSNTMDQVVFDMTDDGCGADLTKKITGLGLIGMRERAEMLDGRFELTSTPGSGFSIHAAIPLLPTA